MITKYFQGDVAYIQITKEQFKKLLKDKEFKGTRILNSFTTVHGESGNQHRIVVDRPTENLVKIMQLDNGMYVMKIKGEATIIHEKHLPAQKLTTGLWFVVQKTEYNPIEERLIRD